MDFGASLVTQKVKNLSIIQETQARSCFGKIPWRKAWQPTLVSFSEEFPWTEEPGGLQFIGLQRVRHD